MRQVQMLRYVCCRKVSIVCSRETECGRRCAGVWSTFVHLILSPRRHSASASASVIDLSIADGPAFHVITSRISYAFSLFFDEGVGVFFRLRAANAPSTTMQIDPAALSRTDSGSTPVTTSKSVASTGATTQKSTKALISVPRLDLEPIYTDLKAAIGEKWAEYKQSTALFLLGRSNTSV
jgi:hypothetical protein